MSTPSLRQVTPEAVALHLCGFTVVDVRELEERTGELGHIHGSRHVPLPAVASAARAWARDQRLLLVCRTGARSGRAAEVLGALGFTDLTNLQGGMLAWNDAGLPVAR